MSCNSNLSEQLSQKFYLQNNFTPDIIGSFRVCVFPLPSTSISVFVNLLDELRSKHKYITYGGKKIPIVYYASSSYQISELQQYFNSQTRVEEENISVKQVPCLQISPAEANLAIQNLNKYISGIEVVKQMNDIYYQFARVKLHSSEYNSNLNANARVINSIGLDLQYLTLEDLAAGDLFPNIVNMHGYIAVGAITENYNDNDESENEEQTKKNTEQSDITEKYKRNSPNENSSAPSDPKISDQNTVNITDSKSVNKHEKVQHNEKQNKKQNKIQFSETNIQNTQTLSQSTSIANTQTIGLSNTTLSDINCQEISVAQMRKLIKQNEKTQDSKQYEHSQSQKVYSGKLERRIAELQHEFFGLIDMGTDPGRLGRGWIHLAVIDARDGQIHEDQRTGWPSDWPAGLDRFGLLHPGVLAACTVLYGLLETRWPIEVAAVLRTVDMHPAHDPQSVQQLMSTILNQLSQVYQVQQSIYNYVMPQAHLSKRHSHKMTFFEAGRAGFHFRDHFYPLHIYKKGGLQYMANALGKYQLKSRNHGQVLGDDEYNPTIMSPLPTTMETAANESAAASMPKGIPYNLSITKMPQIQLQQDNSIFQTRSNLHEITYPYTKSVPLQLRKLRVVYQIALDSVLFGFNQQAIEILNYVYQNSNRQDPSLAFLALFFKHILKQVTNPWKIIKGVDYLVTEGFLGLAFNVLHCTQYTLKIPCQEIAFKVLEFQKLQQFNFLTQNNVFCFFLLYSKLLNESSQLLIKNINTKQTQQQQQRSLSDLSHFLTAFKLIGVFQLFNKPVINRHETTLLQIFMCNLHIIGHTPRDFIDYLVNDMNANLFYQFQQTQLFSVFINNKTMIEHGFYMQVFERPIDQGMILKHIIQSNDHEDMNLNMNLSAQLNYVTEKLQKLQQEEIQQEQSTKKTKTRQHQQRKKSEVSITIQGQKDSLHNIFSPSMTQDAKLNNEQYDLIQQETRRNCIPIQILQPSSNGVEGQFECLKYDFNDVRCRLEISQKVKNEWNNVKAVVSPKACRLQSQINAFKRNEINQFQYQSIANKNASYPQIFLGLPIQLQLSLDHELDVQYLFPYAQVTQLEFNYPIKTQIISQYFDSYSHSLIMDVEFSLVNGHSYKDIIEQNEPTETCGFSIELFQDVKPLQTIMEPIQQETDNEIQAETKKEESKYVTFENKSDDDILGLGKEQITELSLQNQRGYEPSQVITEEFSISNDLLEVNTNQGPPNFVCELFELKKVTLQVNGISLSTTNIQNSKFILYNQYAYLHLQGVQSINYMQFEEQFGYQFINVDKQEWCKGNLLVFEFQCSYHNLKEFMINTERNVYLFSDMGEQIGFEERTFNPEETEKMKKFRTQSILKSNLIQTTIKYTKYDSILDNISEYPQAQGQLQLLSLIDKVTKDKLYLVILAAQQKPSFCFNFIEQVLQVQLSDFSETLLSSQLTMEPYAHLYNGSLYPTTLVNVYNNLNKLVMRRDPLVTWGLVFLAQNETASSEPHGLQGPQLKQHFRDAIAEISQKDFVIERQEQIMTLRLGEKLKNMVQSYSPVIILNIELHKCSINGMLSSVVTPDFSIQLKTSKNFSVVLYLQFNGIDLIKEIVIENQVIFD